MRQPLTKRQREVFDYVADFIPAHGYGPALHEIGQALGLSSTATVHKHLRTLQIKGWIARGWNRSRMVAIAPAEPVLCDVCRRELSCMD